jgi:hypothetical protein
MSVSISQAARLLGRSRTVLVACRSDGRLSGYLGSNGLTIKLEPPGLPPLAEHLAEVCPIRPRANQALNQRQATALAFVREQWAAHQKKTTAADAAEAVGQSKKSAWTLLRLLEDRGFLQSALGPPPTPFREFWPAGMQDQRDHCLSQLLLDQMTLAEAIAAMVEAWYDAQESHINDA